MFKFISGAALAASVLAFSASAGTNLTGLHAQLVGGADCCADGQSTPTGLPDEL